MISRLSRNTANSVEDLLELPVNLLIDFGERVDSEMQEEAKAEQKRRAREQAAASRAKRTSMRNSGFSSRFRAP